MSSVSIAVSEMLASAMSSLGTENRGKTQRVHADGVLGHCVGCFIPPHLPQPSYVKEQCLELGEFSSVSKVFPLQASGQEFEPH